MKAYLFGSIFYEKDIEYNKELLDGIRKAWPGIDIYAPQEAPFNDKKTFASSVDIFLGDYNRLKDVDLLIGCLDGDIPPIGSATECGMFAHMAIDHPEKKMIVLHTDTRDAYKTGSSEKYQDMLDNQCASQHNYFNLFTRGAIESCGVIVGTKEQLFEYVRQLYYAYLRTHHESGIYLITNRVNNKKYIGQAKDVHERLHSHLQVAKENPQAIDLAIRKYGIENFTFEVLEYCSVDDLNMQEAYWANEVYNCSTYAPYGYNIATCGNNQYGNQAKVISCYSLHGQLIKTFPSILAASREYQCNPHSIAQALDMNTRSSHNLLWATGLEPSIEPFSAQPHGAAKKNKVYTLQKQYIGTYDSLTATAEAFNTSLSAVAIAYNNPGFRSICNNFYVIPEEEDINLNLRKTRKKVYQYNMATRQLESEYETAAAAANAVQGDASHLAKVAKGQGYYCKGYIWSYLKYDVIPANFRELNREYWTENS